MHQLTRDAGDITGFDPLTVERIEAFFDAFVHEGPSADRFDRTFADLAEGLRRTLGAAHVTIWAPNERVNRIDEKRGRLVAAPPVLHPVYTSLADADAAGLPVETPLAESGAGPVLEAGRAVFHADLADIPMPAGAAPLRAAGLGKVWSLPVRAVTRQVQDGHPVTALAQLGYPADHPAEAIPPAMVELCGRLAGRAVERALWAEQDLVVHDVLRALDGLSEDKYDAMDTVARAIAHSMQFEACTILLANAQTRSLHVLGTTGIDSTGRRRRMRYPFGYSYSGLVARDRVIFATENMDGSDHHDGPRFTDIVETPAVRQYLGAPVVSPANEMLGVIRLRNKRPPAGRSWPRNLNALDLVRLERTTAVLAPLMSLMVREVQNISILERVRHDMDMPATMIRDSAGHLRRMGPDRLAGRLELVQQKLEDFESLAEILLLNSELLRVHDASDLPFEPEYVMPMGDFVAKLCKMLTPAARRKRLAGVLYVDDSFRSIPRLWLDPRCMQIALFNLVQNGIKYSKEGSLIVVEGESRRIGGDLWHLIHVRNEGIGIAEAYVDRIFERNFRTPQAIRKNSTGLGIGLSIARSMVARHGGRLVLTRRNDPTVFTIELPGHLAEHKPK